MRPATGFLRRERAAADSAHAEHIEEARRDQPGAYLFGIIGAGERETGVAEESHILEDAVLVAPFEEILRAGLNPFGDQFIEGRIRLPHRHQLLGIAKGMARSSMAFNTEKMAVLAPNAERQGDRSRDGEAGILAQEPECVPHYVGECATVAIIKRSPGRALCSGAVRNWESLSGNDTHRRAARRFATGPDDRGWRRWYGNCAEFNIRAI